MEEFLYQLRKNTDRIGILDLYRAIAIILIIIYHFNILLLPLAYIGVDLFFVISGYLVSKPLLKSYANETPVNASSFLLRRGLKIWPSYYFFLFLTIPLTRIFLASTAPNEIISNNEVINYVLFLSNYIRSAIHVVFDMSWSLCVEEHFYLILAISFFIVPYIFKNISWKNKALLIIVVLIFSSVTFKIIEYFFQKGGYEI